MDFVTRFETAMRNRTAFNRTVRALRDMPLDVALDLDIDKGNARAIARRAVYGQ